MLIQHCTNKTSIESIIKNLSIYEEEIKGMLEICDMEYVKIYDDYKRSCDGYVEGDTNAYIIPDELVLNVKEICFCTDTIAQKINENFSRIYDLGVFNKTVEIYIKYIIVHELMHVKQIKEQSLTKEKYECSAKEAYEKRDFEIEADTVAKQIVGNEGVFSKYLVEIISNKKNIDNDIVECLTKMFNQNTY